MTAGESVSHYEIIEKLGEGGMGIVYKARDTRLNRLVALKFLPVEITESPQRIARFEAEARAISALNHPNIATIHAMDEDRLRRFLVLEYLGGGTLRTRMKQYRAEERQFPIAEVVNLGIALAAGLGHAHGRGIVHRDIKPENVMFTSDGTPRITDFGLAKSSHASEITRDGTTVGTAAYMAPEQAMRNETSPRSDLFSLGVILYEITAGKRPFAGGAELAVLHALITEVPPPLGVTRPDTPLELERILMKLLEKDAAQRYRSGEELARDLRVLAGSTTLELNYFDAANTVTIGHRLVSTGSAKRRRVAAVLVIAAVAIVVAGLAWMKWGRMGPAAKSQTAIAALPFTAASGNAEDIAFGNGLAGIVAGKLASLGANVVPESDLRRNRVTTPADARRTLGIGTILTGRIERQPSGAMRVSMQLVDTGSGKTLRSASTAAAPLEDEVLKQAAAMLDLSPDPAAMSRLRAQNTQTATAYDYYVLGNGYLQRWDQAGNLGFAIADFQKAIEVDPAYALAWAGLAAAHWRQYEYRRDQQDLERAREAAIQAISRNESLDTPHIVLGAIAVSAGQVEEGIRQMRLALDRDPVNPETYRQLANAYVAAGRLGEAEATYKQAVQFRPSFWLGYFDIATFYNNHSRYQDAEQALMKAAALTPDNYLVYRNLGGVQMARGEWPEAERSFRKAIELRPQGSVYSNLGTLYIFLGRYAEAIPVLERAVALSGNERNGYLIWGNLGDAYRWTRGREGEAPAAYDHAIRMASTQLELNPDDPALLSQIALFHAKAGSAVEAEKTIHAALRFAPKDPSVLYRSALVFEIQRKRKQSLAALGAAIDSGYSMKVIEKEPELASLRSDAAWRGIANRK